MTAVQFASLMPPAQLHGAGELSVLSNRLDQRADQLIDVTLLLVELLERGYAMQVWVALPQVQQQLAAADGAGGIFEAAEVGLIAVVHSQRRAGLQPDDGVISLQLDRRR